MGLFSKLFGSRGVTPERVESKEVAPVMPNDASEAVQEMLAAQREQTMQRISEWMDAIGGVLEAVRDRLNAHGEAIFSVEAGVRRQVETLGGMESLLKDHGRRFEEMAESLKALPALGSLPQVSEEQRVLLERLEKRLKEQAVRSNEALEVFREISSKLDALPAEERRQVGVLKELASKLEAAARQESAIRQNLEGVQGVLREVSTHMGRQVEMLQAVESTQRMSLRELVTETRRRARVQVILFATALAVAVAALLVVLLR